LEGKFRTIANPESGREWRQEQELGRARQQIEAMKRRNRQLSSVNSRIIEKVGEADEFFVKVLGDLRRKVTARKNFKECSFEDFKQEDKLELLVKVLSNEEVLLHLYQKIFHKQPSAHLAGTASECLEPPQRNVLPAIATARRG
jgi:hypothetical protein